MVVDALRVQAKIYARDRAWDHARYVLEEGVAMARAMPYAEGGFPRDERKIYAEKGERVLARDRLTAAAAVIMRLSAAKDVERTEKLPVVPL